MSRAYDVGDTVRLTGTFRDEAGDLADPTAVVCKVLAPDGTTSLPSVSSSSTGVWTATVAPDQPGLWHYRFTGTGAVTSSEEGDFVVRRRRVQ